MDRIYRKRLYLKRKAPYARKAPSIPKEIAYTGPMKPAAARHQLTTLKKYGSWSSQATTTGAGILDPAFVLSPSTLNDWGNLQNDWTEYRILGVEVEYIPNAENAFVTGLGYGQLAMVIDRTSSTSALTSFQQALEYEGHVVGAVNKRFKISAKARGANELAWVNITTSSYWCSMRGYSNGTLSNTTNYGTYIVNLLVELRSAL